MTLHQISKRCYTFTCPLLLWDGRGPKLTFGQMLACVWKSVCIKRIKASLPFFLKKHQTQDQLSGHATCAVQKTSCLEGPHTWFHALLSPSCHSLHIFNKGPCIFILHSPPPPNSVAGPDETYVTSRAGEKGSEAISLSKIFVMADSGGCEKWGFCVLVRSFALQSMEHLCMK